MGTGIGTGTEFLHILVSPEEDTRDGTRQEVTEPWTDTTEGFHQNRSRQVSGVAEWPVLTNKKEVQSFLGFTNFYRRFMEGFSQVAHPLFDLTKVDSAFHWLMEEQLAFITL